MLEISREDMKCGFKTIRRILADADVADVSSVTVAMRSQKRNGRRYLPKRQRRSRCPMRLWKPEVIFGKIFVEQGLPRVSLQGDLPIFAHAVR
jgi:hypothetical protein